MHDHTGEFQPMGTTWRQADEIYDMPGGTGGTVWASSMRHERIFYAIRANGPWRQAEVSGMGKVVCKHQTCTCRN